MADSANKHAEHAAQTSAVLFLVKNSTAETCPARSCLNMHRFPEGYCVQAVLLPQQPALSVKAAHKLTLPAPAVSRSAGWSALNQAALPEGSPHARQQPSVSLQHVSLPGPAGPCGLQRPVQKQHTAGAGSSCALNAPPWCRSARPTTLHPAEHQLPGDCSAGGSCIRSLSAVPPFSSAPRAARNKPEVHPCPFSWGQRQPTMTLCEAVKAALGIPRSSTHRLVLQGIR